MTFQEWLAARNKTASVKGKVLELLRQADDAEKLILNLRDGKIRGVTKPEWEAARRIIWDFGRAGGVWSDGVRARADRTPPEPGSHADGGTMEGAPGAAAEISFKGPPSAADHKAFQAGFWAALTAAFGLSYEELASEYRKLNPDVVTPEADDDPV